MKEKKHPEMREVVYMDMSSKKQDIVLSTAQTRETIVIDGKTYPLVTVSISAYSHPFYTNQNTKVDLEGRIERFSNKFANRQAAAVAQAQAKAAVDSKDKKGAKGKSAAKKH